MVHLLLDSAIRRILRTRPSGGVAGNRLGRTAAARGMPPSGVAAPASFLLAKWIREFGMCIGTSRRDRFVGCWGLDWLERVGGRAREPHRWAIGFDDRGPKRLGGGARVLACAWTSGRSQGCSYK